VLILIAACCFALAFSWLHFNLKKATVEDFAEDNSTVIAERRELSVNAASLSTVQSSWSQAVEQSLTSGAQVTVQLTENWIGTSSLGYLGTGSGFSAGRIHVPAGANIRLDLNGKKISKNLTETLTDGNVILVEGTLEIFDSSANKRGAITGANSEECGGILVDGGTLILSSGNITKNTSQKGAGVRLENGATFIMNGGNITENVNTPSGPGSGVYIGKDSKFILNDGTISNNTATANGGGGVYIACDTDGYFEMNGGEISGNQASSGEGVYVDDGLFKMTGGKITGNSGPGWGGGVSVCESGTETCDSAFIMTGGEITGNSAAEGGGVCIYPGCTFEMSGGEISGNTATAHAAGVYVNDSLFTMTGGKISGNTTSASYGGVYLAGNAVFTMEDGEISDNADSGDNGGGIAVGENSTFTMNGGKISGNSTPASGGNVYLYGKFVMNGGEISGGSATYGGGVCSALGGVAELNGGEIINNNAGNGGGLYIFSYYNEVYTPTYATINGCKIKGNTAAGNGGGIYMPQEKSYLTIDGGEISGNSATNYGGGIDVGDGVCTVKNALISGNTSGYSGGGVYISARSVTFSIEDSVVTGNTSDSYGGGLTLRGTTTVKNCEIKNNVGSLGGGIYCTMGTLTVENITVTGNRCTGTYGGGVYLGRSTVFNFAGGYIYGNRNTYYAASNLYCGISVITVTGNLANKAYVGIQDSGDAFTSGYTSSGNTANQANVLFFEDSGKEITVNADGELEINLASDISKTSIQWSYTLNGADKKNISTSDYTVQAPYTGGVYSLSANVPFTVKDENGNMVTALVNAGKYTVSADEPAKYYNAVLSFEITPADLKDAIVTAESAVYSGGALTPAVKAELNGRKLIKGVDFTVSYKDNVKAGSGVAQITGAGNYTGTAECNFVIEKANLGVRLGETTVEYNGKPRKVQVYLEGLKGCDTVTAQIAYTLDGNPVDSPLNAGTYIATITIDDENYKFASAQEYRFTVNPKKVNVIWENTTFDYDGQEHFPSAYMISVDGAKVELTVNHPNSVAADTYQATVTALPAGYENYVITSNQSKEYVIEKSAIQAEWGDDDFTYDGTAKLLTATVTDGSGNDISSYLTYEYFDKDGNTTNPVEAGEYIVKITLNHSDFTLGGDTEYKYTIKKAEAQITLGGYDGIYTGAGRTPLQSVTTAGGADLAYKATYAKADASGNATGEYSEELPVNVGKYVLKVEILDKNYQVAGGEYFTEVYEVKAKEITVVWSGDDTSMLSDGVYIWLYDGNKHAPRATADGIDLTVSGESSAVAGVLTATASLDDKNYILKGSLTASYQIIKSTVTGTKWYTYGSDTPIADGEVPEIPYISVYGKEGPKFSAYGALTAADPTVVWTATETAYIKLLVTYPEYEQGYWTVREQSYGANATLAGADKFNDSCTMPLAVAANASFKVTDITHDSAKADIRWIIVGANGEHIDASTAEFIYNGTPQAPKAIRILSDGYNAANPVDGTYEFLKIAGEGVDAGTYYAFIIPEGNYAIDGGVSDFQYIIKPKQITIKWMVGTYVYDGVTKHAPTATAEGTDGIPCTVAVEGFTEAGDWTAVADAGKNFEILKNETCNFTVDRMTLSDVEWSFETGDVGEIRHHEDGDYFVWAYDGNVHTPQASLKVQINGAEKNVSLIVTGGMSEAGTHYAFAALDSADFGNANFKLEVEKLRFDIVRNTVNIVWPDEDVNGEIVYDYDGTEKCPTAYYTAGGKNIPLNVVGAATGAGTYVAYITDKLDIANGATHAFTIKAKELTVGWTGLSVEYDGTEKLPQVTFTDPNAVDPTAQVTLVSGKDYTLTGFVGAGKYVSELTFLNGNYTFTVGTNTSSFEITQKDVTVTWYGNDDGTFEWAYDGNSHAPTLTASVNGLAITVKGAETNVGEYTAVAVLDDGNYNLINAERKFEIKPYEITVEWAGNAEKEGAFEWVFDGGHAFAPTASYTDGEGNVVALKVLGGRIYAGDYTAEAVLPENCAFAAGTATQNFKITRKIVKEIIWTGNVTVNGDGTETETFEWEFDGTVKNPTAKDSTGMALTVTGGAVNAGEHTATAVIADEKNYEFAAGLETTHTFTVTPKKNVNVLWYGNSGTLGTGFDTYAYDGATVHCPVAKFVDVNGNEVEMPVNGGTASAGQFVATAIDVFDNYDFREIKIKQTFEIVKADIVVSWETGYADTDGVYTYTYTYNGKAQLPEATNTTNAVTFAYVVRNAAGVKVDAAVNAGEYTVEVIPNDPNFKIADHATVKVIVEKKSVAVEWGETSFVNDGEAHAPEAWYTDVEGNRVDLAVTGATSAAGATHQATAALVSEGEKSNYTLTNETNTFSITDSVEAEYVWVWDEATSTGAWQIKPSGD